MTPTSDMNSLRVGIEPTSPNNNNNNNNFIL